MILLDILTFLGRMHPLFIHLPIGFILLAIIFDGVSYSRRYAALRGAVPFTLLIGFASAFAACVLGFMLALSGGYDHVTLSNHRLGGILLTVLTGILYGITTPSFQKVISVPARMYSGFSVLALLLIIYTGHQGASLTHGADYLTIETLFHQERAKPSSVEEAMIFEDVVHPVLEQRCMQCHRRDKRKGQLSMESLQSLLKGGKHGPAIVPGDLSESELFRRITLDPDHEDFMPSEGKEPLTREEVEVIRWWIEEGMAVERKVSDMPDYRQVSSLVSAVLKMDAGVSAQTTFSEASINRDIPAGIDLKLVENLRAKGLVVRVMFRDPLMLDVTLPPQSGQQMDDFVNELRPVAANIVWLNLSDNNFTDNDLAVIRDMVNLRKLRLEKNPLSDTISEHLKVLKYLEAVNLNETGISDACVETLRRHTPVKRIYTWKTSVRSGI